MSYIDYIRNLAIRKADQGVLTLGQYDLLADHYRKVAMACVPQV